MLKCLLTLLLCALLPLSPISRAEDAIDLSPTAAPTPAPDAPPLSRQPLLQTPPIHPDCAAALLMEADSGQIIFQMNETTARPVASVTKLMTILLALEALDSGRARLEDVVTVSGPRRWAWAALRCCWTWASGRRWARC